MSKTKTVLVLPGTMWQLPLIDKIKEAGHKVLVVNPASDSPGFSHADGHLQADIFDKSAVIAYAKNHHIDAVMSDECDIAMNLIAELGKEFGVPTLDEETASLFTDKFKMREFCCIHGLKYPEYKMCRTADEAASFARELGRTVIIKPLDSNSSHGVFTCSTEDDIRMHFEEALSFSRSQKAVLVERYIKGVEFTIDSIKTPTGHYCLAISEKKHFKHNGNIANELYFTHSNPRFDYDKLRKLNDKFVNCSNLKFGFTHAEYKCENGEFYLIEIAARGGGNMISSVITQYMSGYDTYRYLVECATGNIHEQSFPIRAKYMNRTAVLKFFGTPDGGGIVKSIEGTDYLADEPDIACFKFNFDIGDRINNAVSDSARIGFYIATCETEDKLKKVMDNVEKYVQIVVE